MSFVHTPFKTLHARIPSKIGTVIATNTCKKTIKVKVEEEIFVKQIGKNTIKGNRYLVHDEHETAKVGDVVRIGYFNVRISNRKKYSLMEILDTKAEKNAELLAEQKRKNAIEENKKFAKINEAIKEKNHYAELGVRRDKLFFDDILALKNDDVLTFEQLSEICKRNKLDISPSDNKETVLHKLLSFNDIDSIKKRANNVEKEIFILNAIKNLSTERLISLTNDENILKLNLDEKKDKLRNILKDKSVDEVRQLCA
ncbi:hypothetical protein ACO0SA_001117 [Hanseniaspora valbyensis]|mgnify:FL=1